MARKALLKLVEAILDNNNLFILYFLMNQMKNLESLDQLRKDVNHGDLVKLELKGERYYVGYLDHFSENNSLPSFVDIFPAVRSSRIMVINREFIIRPNLSYDKGYEVKKYEVLRRNKNKNLVIK